MTAPVGTGGTTSPVTVRRPIALVVDDEPMNRLFIEALLAEESYEVVTAGDGAEAVTRFTEAQPEIIFMDVIMPGMDGYEATRRIKALSGERFVPVIFLTALSDEEALARCVEAGGDDFLTKPYSHSILRSKIAAIQRIRALYARIHTQREELRVLQAQRQRDDDLAQQVFECALAGNNAVPEAVLSLLRPAATFSGDLLLMAPRPGGGLHVLLGDFTGHGLGAAIGALPVSEVFRAMTAKGFAAADILGQLNHKLRMFLPRDMFLSACLLNLDKELHTVEVWNGGMPDVLIVGADGRVRERLPSTQLPLGIAEMNETGVGFERLPVGAGDRVVLCSDGVLEARNPAGEEFGEARLLGAIGQGSGDRPFRRILAALEAFCGAAPQDDDISLVEIPCIVEVLAAAAPPAEIARRAESARSGSWRWTLELQAPSLRTTDPVPLAMGQLQALPEFEVQRPVLYTILSELYANALQHGVLQLDSVLKNSEEGFERYYQLRDQRLASLASGSVRIEIEQLPREAGGCLRIAVEDSGAGFDPRPFLVGQPDDAQLSGRGIGLVRSLCESLRYSDRGNRVEVIYAWDD